MTRLKYVVNFDRLGMGDVERVGGKNASLGEMIVQLSKAGIRVPGGCVKGRSHSTRIFVTASTARAGPRS